MYKSRNIFKFNSNLNYISSNNEYDDVLLYTGSLRNKEWQNLIGVVDDGKIIEYSNSFYMEDVDVGSGMEFQNNEYKIYDNIVNNYDIIMQNNNPTIYDETFFLMADAFSFSNSGHNLSNMFHCVNYILMNNIRNILIFDNYETTNNFKLISLLIPNCNFIKISFDTLYRIKKLIVIRPLISNIGKYEYLEEKLKAIINYKYKDLYSDCIGKNIILIKTSYNNNVFYNKTQYICPNFLNKLTSLSYIYIIPENVDIFRLCIYLMYANKIVFSTGSILYTNQIFFNNCKLIYLVKCKSELVSYWNYTLKKKPLILKTRLNIDRTNYMALINSIVKY